MGRINFTDEQVRKSLEQSEQDMAAAREAVKGGSYTIVDAPNIGAAFRQFLAQSRAMYGAINIEYAMPDGSKCKIVCLQDARNKAEKRLRRAGNRG